MLSTVIVSGPAPASTRWWRRREPGPGTGRTAGCMRFLCSHRVQCWALWARREEKLWLVLIALLFSWAHHLKIHSQLGMELPNEAIETAITVPLLFWIGFSICQRTVTAFAVRSVLCNVMKDVLTFWDTNPHRHQSVTWHLCVWEE